MNGQQLRELQAPLKQRYGEAPEQAKITLRASGELDDASIACNVDTGRALASAGLHPATGGDGLHLCSGDMLLEALVACAGVTFKAVTTSMGLNVRPGRLWAEGDLDFRGTLGMSRRGARRFQRYPSAIRPGKRRRTRRAGLGHRADRALLRRPANVAELPGGQRRTEGGEVASAQDKAGARRLDRSSKFVRATIRATDNA